MGRRSGSSTIHVESEAGIADIRRPIRPLRQPPVSRSAPQHKLNDKGGMPSFTGAGCSRDYCMVNSSGCRTFVDDVILIRIGDVSGLE